MCQARADWAAAAAAATCFMSRREKGLTGLETLVPIKRRDRDDAAVNPSPRARPSIAPPAARLHCRTEKSAPGTKWASASRGYTR
jgi:hypothetical protein